jgi:hypothetical protein
MYYIVFKTVYSPSDSPWSVWPGLEGFGPDNLQKAEDVVSDLAKEITDFVFDLVDDDNVSHFTGDTLEVE